jgi:hypothetical protein
MALFPEIRKYEGLKMIKIIGPLIIIIIIIIIMTEPRIPVFICIRNVEPPAQTWKTSIPYCSTRRVLKKTCTCFPAR